MIGQYATVVTSWTRSQSTTCHSTYCGSLRWQTQETDHLARYVNSSLLIGRNKVYPSRAMVSSISLDKCTKLRNSSVRMDQLRCTAGEGWYSSITVCFNAVIHLKMWFLQCGSWSNGGIYHPQYRIGTNAVWRGSGCVPNGQDTKNAATGHGSNWG